jgi:hypothetical protein
MAGWIIKRVADNVEIIIVITTIVKQFLLLGSGKITTNLHHMNIHMCFPATICTLIKGV